MRPLRAALLPTLLVAMAAAAACGGSAPSTPAPSGPVASPVDPASAARITGHVRFNGAAPAAEVVRISGDKSCVTLNGSDEQSADAIGLEKVTLPIPGEPVVIDQQKCRYVPRVVGVRVGQALQVKNGDPLLHNVRSDPEINQPFNQGQPVQGMAYTHTFTTREVMVPITCDVHAWMRAYVGALEHPYFAVTGEDGAFTLPNLPPGTYTIAAWHERLGTKEQPVTLGSKDTKDVDFTFAR
jgi:plastocyanin